MARSTILKETFQILRHRNGLVPIRDIHLGRYFNFIQTSDGSVGASMSYLDASDAVLASREQELLVLSRRERDFEEFLLTERTGDDRLRLAILACLVAAMSCRWLVAKNLPFSTVQGSWDLREQSVGERVLIVGLGGLLRQALLDTRMAEVYVSDLDLVGRLDDRNAWKTWARVTHGKAVVDLGGTEIVDRYFEQASLIAITGSTLANGTLEGLLARKRQGQFVVVQGQSASIWPSVLFDRGVDLVLTTIKDESVMRLGKMDRDGRHVRLLLEGRLPVIQLKPRPKESLGGTPGRNAASKSARFANAAPGSGSTG